MNFLKLHYYFLLSFIVFNFNLNFNFNPTLANNETKEVSDGKLNSTVNVLSYSGTFNYKYEINTVSGRGSLTPEIILTYNSGRVGGPFGKGFDLEMGAIHRSTKWGVPKYNDQDIFELDLKNTSYTLSLGNDGYYYCKLEGAFFRLKRLSQNDGGINGWILESKDGLKYIFGDTTNSRIGVTEKNIYQWNIRQIVDATGNNRIDFNYLKDKNHNYLESIVYNGGKSRINFYFENRSDQISSGEIGAVVNIRKRLQKIVTLNADTPIMEYSFVYASPTERTLSLLSRITRKSLISGEVKQDASFYYSGSENGYLMTKIFNELNGLTEIEYANSFENKNINKNNNNLPYVFYTVKKLTTYASINKNRKSESANTPIINYFDFDEGAYDVYAREFRGFAKVSSSSNNNQIKTITYFHNKDNFFQGKVKLQEKYDSNGLFEKTENEYLKNKLGNSRVFVSLSNSHTTSFDKGNPYLISSTRHEYDSFGNEVLLHESAGSLVRITKKQYLNRMDKWIIGLPTRIEIISDPEQKQSKFTQRIEEFRYSDSGKPIYQAIILNNSSNLKTIATYMKYDEYGNIIEKKNANGGITTYTYDLNKLLPIKNSNPLNQSTLIEYDNTLHLIKRVLSPDQSEERFFYDGFSRIIRKEKLVNAVLERWEQITYTTNSNEISVSVLANNGYFEKVFYDGMGREIQRQTKGYNNREINSYTKYIGNKLMAKSIPEYQTQLQLQQQIAYTYYQYDERDRVVGIINPKGLKTEISYEQLSKTISSGNKIRREKYDEWSRITEITAISNDLSKEITTKYEYNIFNNLIKTIDPNNNIISIEYDQAGRKVAMQDPDMGNWYYVYDANGNLISQKDNKGQLVNIKYDPLDRIVQKEMYSKENIDERIVYLYSNKLIDPSQIITTKYANNVNNANEEIVFQINKNFQYNNLNLLGKIDISINDYSETKYEDNFTIAIFYDEFARIKRVKYPNNFGFTYNYSYPNTKAPNGLIASIETLDGKPVWKSFDFSALGHPTEMQMGNGAKTKYEFDPLSSEIKSIFTKSANQHAIQQMNFEYDVYGNVIKKNNVKDGIEETFTYDEFNRLIEANIYKNNKNNKVNQDNKDNNFSKSLYYSYDDIGNIRAKRYREFDNIVEQLFSYNEQRIPHAVIGIDIKNNKSEANFKYDLNGNLISDNGMNISYSVDNKVSEIKIIKDTDKEATSSINSINSINYFYDESRNRVIQNAPEKYIIYVDRGYEKVIEKGKVFHVYNAFVNEQRVASFVKDDSSNSNSGSNNNKLLSINYYHTDQIDSVTEITNAAGEVTTSISYDPFGTIREHKNLKANYSAIFYGFTGQELDLSGLYNYKARMYNPSLARFITPDPIVPDISNLQSLNRYSYVVNNPLKYMDHSGHFFGFLKSIFKVFSTVVSFVKKILPSVVQIATGILTQNWFSVASGVIDLVGGVGIIQKEHVDTFQDAVSITKTGFDIYNSFKNHDSQKLNVNKANTSSVSLSAENGNNNSELARGDDTNNRGDRGNRGNSTIDTESTIRLSNIFSNNQNNISISNKNHFVSVNKGQEMFSSESVVPIRYQSSLNNLSIKMNMRALNLCL
ncbi:MAG: hypothetical protein HQK49_18140 [Oligoflexia bacterium]|nr:hypothetical protein [Oligoflexia bacterium]